MSLTAISPNASKRNPLFSQVRVSAVLAALFCAATLATAVCAQESLQRPKGPNAGGYVAPNLVSEPEESPEMQALQLLNRDRTSPECFEETKGRARPLKWDPRLAAIAQAHSEEMARNGYFSHQSLDGKNPAQRVSVAGIPWRAAGENIAQAEDVAQAEADFMNEPKFVENHRRNILNPEYTSVGIGVARGPDGTVYVTQDFAEIPQGSR
jgi:uncharacterized protein YkwD